MTYFSEV
jgi:hypothetical protein